jgi:hypothetical protein
MIPNVIYTYWDSHSKLAIVLCLLFVIVLLAVASRFFNWDAFLRGRTKHIRGPGGELVVAVCTEDTGWIDSRAHEFDKVTVYSKCGRVPQLKSVNTYVHTIPNIGSCDNAYLTYIIDRYDTLPERVEFTKGSTPPTHKYIECVRCLKKGSNDLKFKLRNWSFTNNRAQKFPFHQSKYSSMGEWISDHEVLTPSIFNHTCCNIKYGGHFGATREQIRNVPRSTYVALRNEQNHANEEVDHYIERSWGPMFCS